MKLQQFRYFVEIQKQQLNISAAASVLCTSQSGISKQIKLLEEELGVELFVRNGRRLTAVTVIGEKVLTQANEILNKVESIKKIAEQSTNKEKSIGIATTHTQARYVLPVIVERFLSLYPNINLNIQQGTPEQVAALLEQGEVDIAIATEALANRETLVSMPCYQWSRSIITKKDHDLADKKVLDLEDIVKYPIITYVQGFTARYKQDEIFNKFHLHPNIVLTAVDADVIKTYVRLGLGIGIIADMAFSAEQDSDLVSINVEHLFGISTSQIAVKKDSPIKSYVYSFIEMFAPHLTQSLIKQAITCENIEQRRRLFFDTLIPMY